MKSRGRGGLLLVGSLAGYMGQAQISIYSAVKSFGRVFAERLWLEMREYGVDVLELVLGVSGPKISSRQCGASCGMSVTTVGRDRGRGDPVRHRGRGGRHADRRRGLT